MAKIRTMGFALTATLGAIANAAADVVTVNDFGDEGPGDCESTCTLRDAVAAALAAAPIGRIEFSPEAGWPQTITLTHGQLTIANAGVEALEITGPGVSNLAISAADLSRVFEVVSGALKLSGLMLRDGRNIGSNAAPGAAESGETGGFPGVTTGGCVNIAAGASAEFDRIDVRHCAVAGGKGGAGGSGVPVRRHRWSGRRRRPGCGRRNLYRGRSHPAAFQRRAMHVDRG